MDYILECLQKLLPEFKIANAVIHFDEASPHMHVVGVPVWEGAKRGLSKKVSKRNVFTPQTLSVILQDKLREEASYGFECYFKEQLAEKKKGRNHDLSVTEYKVAQESRKLADIKQHNNEEQEKNTKLRSNNASISYQIATQEQRHSRNLDVIAADEDRLEKVRSSINAAETEYAKYEDMIMDKKNNLELLSSKESELIERTKIAENVYDMFRQGGTDDVREKIIDVMYENQKLREENTTLKELLEKAYETGKKVKIKVGNEERVEFINTFLWTFNDQSFIPHGSRKDGFGEMQPIWLSAGDDNPNGATMLFLVDGAKIDLDSLKQYERVFNIFDGNSETAVNAARTFWKELKGAGEEIYYWQQEDNGRWKQKA